MTANLLACPMYKIEDRRAIVSRILDALLADPDCRYTFSHGEWKSMTPDEVANWESRELLVRIRDSFPVASDEPPVLQVEPPHDEPVQDPTQL